MIKYRRKKVTKYLRLPYPSIQKHYDFEYGDYEGLLLTIEWYTTKIPIGKETIKVPVYKKMGGIIKFTRYSGLDKPSKKELVP